MPRYGSCKNLIVGQHGGWEFTLEDGRRFKTDEKGTNITTYSATAKKFVKTIPEDVGGLRFVSTIRPAALKMIVEALGDFEVVHSLDGKKLTISEHVPGQRGRRPLSFYGIDVGKGVNGKLKKEVKTSSITQLIKTGVVEKTPVGFKANKFKLFLFGNKK